MHIIEEVDNEEEEKDVFIDKIYETKEEKIQKQEERKEDE